MILDSHVHLPSSNHAKENEEAFLRYFPDRRTAVDYLRRTGTGGIIFTTWEGVWSDTEQELDSANAEVLEFIADKVRTNFRELEGTLVSLIAYSSVERNKSLLELASEITESIIGEEKTEINIDKVERSVCEYFNITREALLSKSRKRQIVQARQIAMYLCRNLISNCSLATIGAEIGGKDHATVLHACTTVSDLMSTDRNFKKYVTDIESMLAPADR